MTRITTPLSPSTSTFSRVLIGVDGTDAGYEACRQARMLAAPGATLEAVAVVHLADAIQVGLEAQHATDVLRADAEAALAEARRILGDRAEIRFMNGFVTPTLLHEIDAFGATTIAIGSHGHRRLTEIVLGGVAGELLHSAPCSVLLARKRTGAHGLPGRIVVGVDGSEHARLALAAARELGQRLSVPVEAVVATGGKDVDLDAVRQLAPEMREIDARPADALVDAAAGASLLAVGSRGLHGIRALGSVSERVAHRAACSVLVVRALPAR
jgi:nucleotide-binding universal stress UspA family protein